MRAPGVGPIRGRVGGGLRREVKLGQPTLDGRAFPEQLDNRIDRLVHLVFGNPNGRELLEFLQGITLRTVLAPDASDAQLRDLEGQRRLVAMLVQRSKRAVET